VASPTQNNLEEIRTEANFILKVVDQCIKAGLLDEAKGHLDKARIIDPTNAYIYAFQERIAFLKEEATKKNAAVSNRSAMEDAARARLEEERKRAEMERLKKEVELQKQREEWLQKKLEAEKRHKEETLNTPPVQSVQEPVAPPKTSEQVHVTTPDMQRRIENISKQQYETAPVQKSAPAPAQQFATPQSAAPTQQKELENIPQTTQAPKTTDQAHDMYKRVLMLAWADGAVSPEEQSQLRDLRTTLRITTEEHIKLELAAKEESYAHAFTLVWTSGMNAKERSAVINELRYKYQISPEAHSRIEAKVLVEFGEHQDKPMLYVIDDDENTLGMIVRVLEGGGFSVQAYNTSDEALTGLKVDTPALIISDINLETSTIGGFSFYEKVRQLHHLSLVPFIFLSGMTDEGMVRYGKGLGADDYLTKPFSGDMLVDTVKGKLKRYKQMKHN
jgi:CheY-like chemotaxis protein/tellurite resistance protein